MTGQTKGAWILILLKVMNVLIQSVGCWFWWFLEHGNEYGNGVVICGSANGCQLRHSQEFDNGAKGYSSVLYTLAFTSINSLFRLLITASVFCLSSICLCSTISPFTHCHQLRFNHGTTTINPNHQTIDQDPFLPSISAPTSIHPTTSFLRWFLLRRWRRRSQRREPIRPRLEPLSRPRTPRAPSPSSRSRHRRWTHKEGSRRSQFAGK